MADYVLCKDCEHAPDDVLKPFAECQNPDYVSMNYRDGSLRGIACHQQNHDGKCQGFKAPGEDYKCPWLKCAHGMGLAGRESCHGDTQDPYCAGFETEDELLTRMDVHTL